MRRRHHIHYYGGSSIEKVPINWPKWFQEILDKTKASSESNKVKAQLYLDELDKPIAEARDEWEAARYRGRRNAFVEGLEKRLKSGQKSP
ncbi:MAG: hypothetical protein ACT4P2_11740 [Pseudomonadota bacterium]